MQSPVDSPKTDSAAAPGTKTPVTLSVLLGILLPLIAIGLKEFCAGHFFDPAPSWGHVALLLIVPVYHVLVLTLWPQLQRRFRLDWVGGIVLGIGIVYTVVFAPLYPMAVPAIIIAIGILPFAPLGALIATLVAQRRMYRIWAELDHVASEASVDDDSPYRVVPAPATLGGRTYRVAPSIGGAAIGAGLLLLAEAPDAIVSHGLQQAASPDRQESAYGVAWLRDWGAGSFVLERADRDHRRRLRLLDTLFGTTDQAPEQLRRIYYQMTGENPHRREGAEGSRRWVGDEAQGTNRIGSLNRTLSLVDSRMDGSIDATAALGYVEWTQLFRNNGPVQAEARARVALPKGGVVSRVTLWVDGEPREAAFGETSQVKEAYQRVVRRRRDPLLVTAAGPERVSVQCFPIAPQGGEMKIRIGITFPLQVTEGKPSHFVLPRIVAKNFEISDRVGHGIWIESDSAFVEARGAKRRSDGSFALRVERPEALYTTEPVAFRMRQAPAELAWSWNERAEPRAVVQQRFKRLQLEAPTRIAVVVDTSRAMAPVLPELAAALGSFPPVRESRLLLATDAGFEVVAKDANASRLQSALRDVRAVGGINNLPALVEGARWAAEGGAGVVLWIHGSEPVPFGSREALAQVLERSDVRLRHAQVSPGEHLTLTELKSHPGLEALPRRGPLRADIERQFRRWAGSVREFKAVRQLLPVNSETSGNSPDAALPESSPDAMPGHKTSDHLTRLWALEQVQRRRLREPESAASLAVRQQLVTPVSGAVVLEAAQQYADAGLEPGAPADSPSVPEPELWLLLILVASGLLWRFRKSFPRLQVLQT